MKLLYNHKEKSARILFKPTSKSSNSLIINPNEKNCDGEVILVGEGVQVLKVGDKVRKFVGSTGTPIEYNGEKCLILFENGDIEMKL